MRMTGREKNRESISPTARQHSLGFPPQKSPPMHSLTRNGNGALTDSHSLAQNLHQLTANRRTSPGMHAIRVLLLFPFHTQSVQRNVHEDWP